MDWTLSHQIITTSVAVFFLLRWLLRVLNGPSYHPTIEDNHTIPPKKALEVELARREGRGAIFHGSCCDCIWRHQNTTHTGLVFCRGCQNFAPNWDKPDRCVSEYHLEKL